MPQPGPKLEPSQGGTSHRQLLPRRAHLTRFMDEGALRIRGQQECPHLWAFLLASNAQQPPPSKGTFIHEACEVRTACRTFVLCEEWHVPKKVKKAKNREEQVLAACTVQMNR